MNIKTSPESMKVVLEQIRNELLEYKKQLEKLRTIISKAKEDVSHIPLKSNDKFQEIVK